MRSALSRSADIGMAAFGVGDRFPTPAELFNAIVGAGIASKVLYPNASSHWNPDVQAASDEIDRQNAASMQELNEAAMMGLEMTTQ